VSERLERQALENLVNPTGLERWASFYALPKRVDMGGQICVIRQQMRFVVVVRLEIIPHDKH